MNILVTGGAGFIGSHLTEYLITRGDDVYIIDDLSTGLMENLNPNANFIDVDISNSSHLDTQYFQTMMDGIDVVFHLAAKARVQPSVDNPAYYNHVNVQGIVNMLKASVDCRVNRFIFTPKNNPNR